MTCEASISPDRTPNLSVTWCERAARCNWRLVCGVESDGARARPHHAMYMRIKKQQSRKQGATVRGIEWLRVPRRIPVLMRGILAATRADNWRDNRSTNELMRSVRHGCREEIKNVVIETDSSQPRDTNCFNYNVCMYRYICYES